MNTFYEFKSCMWKHFIPPSFKITREQQSRIENFIDIGMHSFKILSSFLVKKKDFENNLDLLLSKQREGAKHKREKEKFEKLRAKEKKREQEECEKNEKKKKNEEEKAKEEMLRKAKEENERKEFEEREKIRQKR